MSNRQIVINLVNKLPANTPLEEIARKIAFVAGVRQGLAEAKRGEGISIDEARQLLKEWAV
jgi:predicted transcriptional regulator